MSHNYFTEERNMYAVVDDYSIYYPGLLDERVRIFRKDIPRVHNISDLLQIAEEVNRLSIWVLPGSQLSARGTKELTENVDSSLWDIITSIDTDGHIENASGFRKSDRWTPQRYILFPEYHSAWNIDTEDVNTLLATLFYLEQQVGTPLKGSPVTLGFDLLTKEHKSHKRINWLQATVNEKHELPLSVDMIWRRKIRADEMSYKYIHCLDKNSAYLSSARGINVGVGYPTYSAHPHFDSALPACWYLKNIDRGYIDASHPDITRGISEGWLWTPTVTHLIKKHVPFEIEQAYIWEENAPVLQTWASDLWIARANLKNNVAGYKNAHACKQAYEQVKLIATQTVGCFAKKPDITWKNPYKHFHPDWWSMIVDETVARAIRRYEETVFVDEVPVFMVYADAFYILSNSPDVEKSIPNILSRQDRLGGYKLAYTTQLSKVIDAIQGDVYSSSDLISILKKNKECK